ncbi:hypothetical protein [Pedobacter sp. BMA]|uniref:hypothetical protein n=1 Tax=Pedobacter sp. BMA TaxID=1663685 RepID=UPI0006498B39|nr:hypothetical protein [Pedobacter sp. BMA]KLT66079.1 hypothetical protein AB669_07885 [Pedobacter sp. BMA]
MFNAVFNVPSAEPMDIRWFYNKYAAMLLGYINGIVQDHQKAEDQMAFILTSFAKEFNVQESNNLNIWFQLRQYAQRKLAAQTIPMCIEPRQTKNLEVLSELEKEIFCAVYYSGKSIAYLAVTLKKNEDEIRNQLRLSVDKMRRVRGN